MLFVRKGRGWFNLVRGNSFLIRRLHIPTIDMDSFQQIEKLMAFVIYTIKTQ